MSKLRRSDIDSLRAISVISVIVFHLDQSFFPRGYLGVDLFFVISGYVITKSILKQYHAGKFSFTEFYLKRIKRIFPALLTVLIFSLAASSVILLTADLKKFSESLIASLGFISNFYFWITGGYFFIENELKPLLHLWSLSVEEQFYLFFPLFLYFIFKIFKKKITYLFWIILISSISFGINLFFLSKGHTDAIFFLFPARIWQFGIGVFFAFLPNLRIKNLFFDSIYLFLALGLIVFNFIFKVNYLPDSTLMCMGAALILYKLINEKNILSNIFKIEPLIFIGIISYSLYLWHWPLISFLKYSHLGQLPLNYIFLCVLLLFCLSFFSWKFIEQPFLYKHSNKTTLKFVTLSYLILLVLCFAIISVKNIPSRYDKFPNLLASSVGSTYNCSVLEYRKFGDTYACLINSKTNHPIKNILFGNSHAFMYGHAFKDHWINSNQKGLIIQLTSCLPFIDKNISKECLEKSRDYYQSIIKSNDIKNVIIGLTWYTKEFVDESGELTVDEDFLIRKNSLNYLINSLRENNKEVYLIGPIPKPEGNFASELSRQIVFEGKTNYKLSTPRNIFDQNYSSIINYYKDKLGKNFLEPHKMLCDLNNCYLADQGGSFFSDSNHLSYYGAMKMKKLIENIN